MYFEMQYRVPYGDTDKMGVVYYANYLEYFERGRPELMRHAGMSYADMERAGFMLPVSEAYCKYIRSAKYDDLLTFRSWVSSYSRVKFTICTEVRRDDELLASGHVVLGCVDVNTFKVTRMPQQVADFCAKCALEEEKK